MMFENTGEIVVLAMAVAVTWMAAWGIAEWRFTRYERSVRSYAPLSGSQRYASTLAEVTPLAAANAQDFVTSTVRIVPAPQLQRTA